MNSMKRQKYRKLKEELCRSVGAQYATGNQWRNNSREKEEMEPKQKNTQVVDTEPCSVAKAYLESVSMFVFLPFDSWRA